MNVLLAYGQGHLPVELPDDRTTVILPRTVKGLPDERAAVREALEHPIGSRPLRQLIRPGHRICISFSDITRATPNHRLIPWLLDFLAEAPRESILLLNQVGTHRPNTQAELETMLTPEVVANYRVLNHEPENPAMHARCGTLRSGSPAWINRHVMEADLRIVTGFIEPHFFAGFSGGPKGIIPGTASLETVTQNHGAHNIGHPNATFGITEGNPLWEELRDVALEAGPTFLLNVTLNEARQITGVFAGDLIQAHRAGCEFVKATAMEKVAAPFDVVVTTNSGYPLDLNLYQGVKGMSAAARIVKPGGTIILACECREGLPAGSPFCRLLKTASTPDQLLTALTSPGFSHPEQWQVQIQALVQKKARVLVYSSLSDKDLTAAHLDPCRDIGTTVIRLLRECGPDAQVGVLPYGPLSIPYLG